MSDNRRRSERVPVGFYVDQYINDEAQRCFTTDLSCIGLYMERLVEPLERKSNVVQLEVSLPGENDSIWARGEVVYDRFDSLFHGTAVRFTGMPRVHQRMLREWLRDTKNSDRFIQRNPFRPSRPKVQVVRPEIERDLERLRLAA